MCEMDKTNWTPKEHKATECLRRKWDYYSQKTHPYKNHLRNKESQVYELLWDTWYDKFRVDPKNEKIQLLREFIENEFVTTCMYTSFTAYERKQYHELCDKLGLDHETIVLDCEKRALTISKPSVWRWEYTNIVEKKRASK
jgi:hypothetical protein